jgi:hypothetical protein
MYRVFLEAAMEQTTIPPSVARKALAHLGSQRMSVLKKKIYESEFGKQLVSATNNYIQVHAKDEVAIGKVTRASSILKDARVPNLVLSGVQEGLSDARIVNFGMVVDMSCIECLGESLCLVAEAIKLFTPASLDAHCEQLKEWAVSIVRALVFFDECTSIFLQALKSKGEFGEVLFPSMAGGMDMDGPGAVKGEVIVAAVASISEDFADHTIDDMPMKAFAERLTNFCGGLPQVVRAHLDVDKHVETIRTTVVLNYETREHIVKTVNSLSLITDLPGSAVVALDDWVGKRAVGKEESSFMCRALALNENASALQGHGLSIEESDRTLSDPTDVTLELDDGSGLAKLVGSYDCTCRMPAAPLALPVFARIKTILQGSLQVAVSRFVAALSLRGVLLPRNGFAKAPNSLSQKLLVLCDRSPMQDFLKQVPEVFGIGGKQDYRGQADALLALVLELTSAWPDAEFAVSVALMCDGPDTDDYTVNSKDKLRHFLHLTAKMVHLAMVVPWLHQKFLGDDAEPVVREDRVNIEVEHAVGYVRSSLGTELRDIKDGKYGDLQGFAVLPCVCPVSQAAEWMQLLHQLVPDITRAILRSWPARRWLQKLSDTPPSMPTSSTTRGSTRPSRRSICWGGLRVRP